MHLGTNTYPFHALICSRSGPTRTIGLLHTRKTRQTGLTGIGLPPDILEDAANVLFRLSADVDHCTLHRMKPGSTGLVPTNEWLASLLKLGVGARMWDDWIIPIVSPSPQEVWETHSGRLIAVNNLVSGLDSNYNLLSRDTINVCRRSLFKTIHRTHVSLHYGYNSSNNKQSQGHSDMPYRLKNCWPKETQCICGFITLS